jgi:hypothetical protein
VEGISFLLGCELAGDKVLIKPIVSNDPSYDENELENTEAFTVCVVARTMRKICEEEETLFQDGSTGTSEVELNKGNNKITELRTILQRELKHTFSADANHPFFHGDCNSFRYSTDTDKKCCLDIYEDQKSHLDTIKYQKSVSDCPSFKQKIGDVSNGSLTRERPIGAQKEDQELAQACRAQWRRQRRFVFAVL